MIKVIKLSFFWISFILLFSCLGFILLEIGVRIFLPEINFQDIEYSLLQKETIGKSFGWKPFLKGICFGKMVEIDGYGFRKIASPDNTQVEWLILGDSVTFGVGVEAEKTFPGLIQPKFPSIKIWNTAVVGYSIQNYQQVLSRFLNRENKIKRVLLFFCLNDVDSQTNGFQKSEGHQKILKFLRRKSKLYLFLKNTISDRSKAYFKNDFCMYDENNPSFISSMKIICAMHEKLKKNDVDFTVIILPYEYQFRKINIDVLKPQKLLTEFFQKTGIESCDLYPCFRGLGGDPKRFYLYGDGIHFSEAGHKVIFDCISKFLSL